jgi:hypothetical protein
VTEASQQAGETHSFKASHKLEETHDLRASLFPPEHNVKEKQNSKIERTKMKKEKMKIEKPTDADRLALRLLVRAREDFQYMRKAMDNRIGRKADGEEQNVEERLFRPEDLDNFVEVSNAARVQEKEIEKRLLKMLRRFPIWNEWLKAVKGVGPVVAAQLIANIDIEKATTVSKIWQYCGLNPGMVAGKKRKDREDGSFELIVTTTMIRGDKLTAGFVAPFNRSMRTVLMGLLAPSFIKAQAPYAMEHYYPYKHRLAESENVTREVSKGGKEKELAWKDAKLSHRDMAARRKMVKAFLADLYQQWRTLEGMPVRVPYAEEYLGRKHAA